MNLKMLQVRDCVALASRCHYQPAEMAREFGCSLRQLERKFAAIFGKTPRQWLNTKRTLDAMDRLKAGESPKVVSIELGYADVSHMHRQFKAYYGVTPGEVLNAVPGLNFTDSLHGPLCRQLPAEPS